MHWRCIDRYKIAGAGIDVFEMEPPVPAGPVLHDSKHTIVTPHVAFASDEALFQEQKLYLQIYWLREAGRTTKYHLLIP